MSTECRQTHRCRQDNYTTDCGPSNQTVENVEAFEMWCNCRALRLSDVQHVSNVQIPDGVGQERQLLNRINFCKLRLKLRSNRTSPVPREGVHVGNDAWNPPFRRPTSSMVSRRERLGRNGSVRLGAPGRGQERVQTVHSPDRVTPSEPWYDAHCLVNLGHRTWHFMK